MNALFKLSCKSGFVILGTLPVLRFFGVDLRYSN